MERSLGTQQHPVVYWIERLSAVTVPCAPIYDMRQLFDDPHVQGRGLAMTLPHGSGVDVPALRSPLRLSASPVTYRAPPMLGQHTAEVLGDTLGKSAAQIKQLRTSGVIGNLPG